MVGWLSDLLKPTFGEESLRYALVIIVMMTPWALYHYWRAGVLLKRAEDQAASTTSARNCARTVRPSISSSSTTRS